MAVTAQRPNPEKVEGVSGVTQRAAYDRLGRLILPALGLWEDEAPCSDPSGWGVGSRYGYSQRQTYISLYFPRAHSQALCQVLCISYPPHSQSSKLRPRERPPLLKTALLFRGWLRPESRPTSPWAGLSHL